MQEVCEKILKEVQNIKDYPEVESPYNNGWIAACEAIGAIIEQAATEYNNAKTKQTQADSIRSMSDEELANLITGGELYAICPLCKYYGTNDCYIEHERMPKNCDKGIMDWLQSEVEG